MQKTVQQMVIGDVVRIGNWAFADARVTKIDYKNKTVTLSRPYIRQPYGFTDIKKTDDYERLQLMINIEEIELSMVDTRVYDVVS